MAIRVPRELTESDPGVLAPATGLVAIGDDEPGLGRQRLDDEGFRYHDAFGVEVDRSTAERLDALAIPPAWNDVWICPDPDGYLQASGHDDAGRKQYRYHDDYRAFAEQRKFERLHYFGRAVVLVRKAVAEALERPLGDRDRSVAAAVRLIDEQLLRVGNSRSAEQGHYGATTLTVDHIDDSGRVQLDYVAKSGKERSIVVADDELADILVELAADADDELFWFDVDPDDTEDDAQDDDPDTVPVAGRGRRRATAADVNEFIVAHAGPAFSARDFRTWGGSCVALEARARGAELLEAIDEAADDLGNTRAVARSSYVHPVLLDATPDEIDRVWRSSRSSKWLDRSESALTKLLADG